MVKFIYTSDWHLGKRQYGLKHREQDRYDAAWYIIKYAAEHGIKAIFNGGDILDVTRPTSRAVNELRKMHLYMIDHNIIMFLVEGNHDKTTPPWFDLFIENNASPSGGIVLLQKELIVVPDTDFTVYGVPEMPVDKLVEHLNSDDAPRADLLLTHVMVRDWIGFKSPNALELSDLPNKYRHAVIGDVHKTAIERHGEVMCISPGSIELGARDEQQTKYFQVYDTQTDKIESKTIPTRPVAFVEIRTEDEMEAGLKAIAEADKVESLIYLTYDPSIDGIMSRVMSKKTQPKTYIDEQTEVEQAMRQAEGTEEEDSDELRSFESFASDFTEDSAVITAFGKVVSTDNAMDDIVEELVADITGNK